MRHVCKHCCRRNAIISTYLERVFVELGLQHAMRMRIIVFCGLPDSTIFFFTLSHKRHDIRRKELLNTQCVSICSTYFVWNISHSRKNRARYDQNCKLVKYPLFLSNINETWNFQIDVDKKNQLDVTFCLLYFSSNSCSTCFGQPCAHHQELTTAWCYSLVLVCAVAAGRLSRPK